MSDNRGFQIPWLTLEVSAQREAKGKKKEENDPAQRHQHRNLVRSRGAIHAQPPHPRPVCRWQNILKIGARGNVGEEAAPLLVTTLVLGSE